MNLFFLISLFAFLSCSQIQPISEVEVHQDDSKQFEALFSENIPEGVTPIRSFQVEKQNIVRKKVIEKYPVKKTSQKGLGFDKKYEKHELFKWWVKYFTGRDKERFQRVINRSLRYEELVKSTLRSEGLPEDLFYLAFIESGFVIGAKSRASAVGIWQFMAGTGTQYGLYIDDYIDERNDPVRSTKAAAKYLRKLYQAYQNWELALAAYNTGEYRILTAVMKGETRDYWTLCQKKFLPRETRNYVPKLMAAMKIAKNYRKYGFYKSRELKKFGEVKGVSIPSGVSLKRVATTFNLPYRSLKEINPHISEGEISPSFDEYKIWVPSKRYAFAMMQKDKLNKYVPKKKKFTHRVRPGENLSSIANKYSVSVSQIRMINKLKSNRIYVGQKLFVQKRSRRKKEKDINSYRVKRGDTLFKISTKFNIRISNLMKYNNLKSKRVYVGQKINLGPLKSHKVKPGESLNSIARKYGVQVRKIMRKNSLTSTTIFPGQVLRL